MIDFKQLAARTPRATSLVCWADIREWLDDIAAAEDAEREGQGEPIRACCGRTNALCECRAPAPTLPPLDAALVEECARAWATARGSIQDGIAAALTHYRERVEGPLLREKRQACMEAHDWEVAYDEEKAEADRLRGELNQYDERGHEAKLEIDRLRGELAKQVEANRLLAEQRDAHSNARQAWQAKAEGDFNPQPTDEERRRLAYRCRYQSGPLSTDTRERIATLLESPQPQRGSIGRRWVTRTPEGITGVCPNKKSADHWLQLVMNRGTIVLCDLVPVEGEEP